MRLSEEIVGLIREGPSKGSLIPKFDAERCNCEASKQNRPNSHVRLARKVGSIRGSFDKRFSKSEGHMQQRSRVRLQNRWTQIAPN